MRMAARASKGLATPQRRVEGMHAGPSPLSRRVTWGLADQALSSASNFILNLLVLRYSTTEELGYYAVAFAAYVFALNVSRAFSGLPLLVRTKHPDATTPGAVACALGNASAFAIVLVIVALFSNGTARSLCLVLAVGLPALLVQDCFRFIAFADGSAKKAFRIDAVWLFAQAVATCILLRVGDPSAAGLMSCWCAGAALSICATRCFGIKSLSRGAARAYLSENVTLIKALVVENVSCSLVTLTAPFVCIAVLSVYDLGVIRGAFIMLGLAMTIHMGAMPILTTEAGIRSRRDPRSLYGFVCRGGFMISMTALLYGLTLAAMPQATIVSLFGSNAAESATLIIGATIGVAAMCFVGVLVAGMRFVTSPQFVAAFRASVAVLEMLGAAGGGFLFDGRGYVIGGSAMSLLSLLVAILVIRAAHMRSSDAET